MNHRKSLPFALATFLLAAGAALPAAAQCTPQMSATAVAVTVRSGTLPDDTERTEHIRITRALADRFCIGTVSSNGNDSPQIRVEITDDPTKTDPADESRSVGVFTVNSIDESSTTGAALRVEVWGLADPNDDDNGLRKLFPSATSAASISGAEATVHRLAPSRTTEVRYSLAGRATKTGGVTQHYSEPDENPGKFVEYVEFDQDHEIAILVPHGGGIEPKISDRIWRIDTNIDMYTPGQADIWEGYGQWGSGQTSRRWHITSSDFSPLSFPGLAKLTDQAAVNPYLYSVAVHGFGHSGKGVIIGGQASLEAKCYVAQGIRDRLLTRRDEVAITIYFEDGNGVNAIEIPDGGGKKLALATYDHLRGMDDDNIVNRLSPNPGQLDGFGAFQIEISKGLRDDYIIENGQEKRELLDAVMSGVGQKIGNLYNYYPAATDACQPFPNPVKP